MWRHLETIFRLGIKELYSLRRDPVLVALILYTFSFAVYTVANGVKTEVRNASIAFVDEDGSELSRRIRDAFLRPYFKSAVTLPAGGIDTAMDAGQYTFVIDIPPNFQADVIAARNPALQVNVDATAMTLAGNGSIYIQSIINQELTDFVSRSEGASRLPIALSIRARFNPRSSATSRCSLSSCPVLPSFVSASTARSSICW
jgi:ABC-2 type transport system permease protein